MKARIIAVAALIGVTASIAAAGDVSLKFRLVVTDRTSTLLPFVYTDDGMEEEGTIHGYSTYEFENGDSLTAKFDGGWSAAGFEGAYEVLSGTGAYDGATGTGTFGTTTFPWEDATLFDGTFTLQVPGS
jgi:hypothetical protein